MDAETPVACALDAGQLKERLAAIEEVGARGLTSRTVEGNRHILRFRGSRKTRRQLEAIIAGEADCCSFLDLSLRKDGKDLVLSIAAPEHAKELGDQLADSFESDITNSPPARISRAGILLGAGGLALGVCCLAVPVVFGIAIGAALGRWLDAAAALIVAAGVAVVLHHRRRAKKACC
jgi:hypothetical protein